MNKILVFIVFLLVKQITLAQDQRAGVICIFNERYERLAETAVQITDANGKRSTVLADFSGNIKFKAVFPISLQINRVGYEPYTAQIKDTAEKVLLKSISSELTGYVVTGQTEIKRIENAPQKIFVIDSKRIQQLGAVSLREVLINELNFRQSNDQYLGASVSIRGMGGRNIKILVDGVPMVGRENGNIDLSQVVLSNIDRIEIIEGPMAVNFGGDALAGVINLITKKNISKKVNGQMNLQWESVGRYNADVRVGFANKKISWSSNGGRYFFGGFDTMANNRFQLWKPKTQYFLENQFVLKTSKSSFMRWQLNGYTEKLSAKGPISISPYEAYAIDQYFYTTRGNATVNFEKKYNNNDQLEILISAQHYRRERKTFYKDMVALRQWLTANTDEQDTTIFNGFLSRGTYNVGQNTKRIQWQAGYEATFDYTAGKKLYDGKQTMANMALFGNLEYKVTPLLLVRLGSRINYNNHFGMPVVPAVHLKFTPKKSVVIRASYARGFRAPSLKEMYLTFIDQNHRVLGNSGLKAELSHNINIDVDLKYGMRKIQASNTISLYYNDISDMIALVATNMLTNEYSYQNYDGYRNVGLNLTQNINWKQLGLRAGGAFMGSESLMGGKLLSNLSWEMNGSINYKITSWKADVNVFYKYNSSQNNYILNSDVQSVSTYMISGYHWMDASVNKAVCKNKLMLTLGAKNIFNVTSVATSGNNGGAHSGSNASTPMGYGRTGFFLLKYYL